MRHFSLASNPNRQNAGQFEIRILNKQQNLRFPMGRRIRARFVENNGMIAMIPHDRGVGYSFGYVLEVFESRLRRSQVMEFRVSPNQVGLNLHFCQPGEEVVLDSHYRELLGGRFGIHWLRVNGKEAGLGGGHNLLNFFKNHVQIVQAG